MKRILLIVFIFAVGIFRFCSFPERKVPARQRPIVAKRMRLPQIVIKDGTNHQFTFTNKISGFFVGNSHRYNQSSFEGWTVNEVHIFRDYRIFKNGHELKRTHIRLFRYLPFRSERVYGDGTEERFTLFDSTNAILIALKAPRSDDYYELQLSGINLKRNSLPSPNVPVTIKRIEGWPGKFLRIDYLPSRKKLNLFLLRLVDSLQPDTLGLHYLAHIDTMVLKRRVRLRKLLNRYPFRVKNERLQNALEWAVISMDALVTHQRGPGIWAGLPWFNNYWGRDTFISLPGALLVTGHFDKAKQILSNFARFQQKEDGSRLLGRIPNRITNKEVIYNTADGTWWFIRSLYQYYLYTGDRGFLKAMFPHIRLAIEGARKYRTDQYGFLTHGDAETWMDAVGAQGAWSPRGNRAVEIQALWYTALNVGIRCAQILKTDSAKAGTWQKLAKKLWRNFNRFFWDSSRTCLYDHLKSDGTPSEALRPNQIFALTVPDLADIPPLLSPSRRKMVARKVTENLTTRQGVLSLWFKDRHFHPYHHYLPYYPPDAAYHNGLIWSWLAGPVLSAQLAFNQIYPADTLYLNEARQIMRNDAIGNFAELLEPVARKGRQDLLVSGAISQAWSLAEFIRNFYQDIVGYRPIAAKNRIIFKPHLPADIPEIRCRLPYKNGFLDVHLQKTKAGCKIDIHSSLSKERIDGKAYFANDSLPVTIFLPDSGTNFIYEYISTDTTSDSLKILRRWKLARIDSGLKFPVISQLSFTILQPNDVYFPLGSNGPTVLYATDAINDDHGPKGNYQYPSNKIFAAGIADLKRITVYDNGAFWGFRIDMRNLIDPNWHPEYGFQLTYLALAINDPSLRERKDTRPGHLSHFQLPGSRAFNRIIYVGGGLEIRDGQNKRLALYVPTDRKHPLGFLPYKQIRFQIPKTFLPGLNGQTKITVLAGLQDDHGGSGLGDFRAVFPRGDQWHGGGAVGKNAPAVYDILRVH